MIRRKDPRYLLNCRQFFQQGGQAEIDARPHISPTQEMRQRDCQDADQAVYPNFVIRPVKSRLPMNPQRVLEIAKRRFHRPGVRRKRVSQRAIGGKRRIAKRPTVTLLTRSSPGAPPFTLSG